MTVGDKCILMMLGIAILVQIAAAVVAESNHAERMSMLRELRRILQEQRS